MMGKPGANVKDKEIPKHNELIEYNYAVAGHAGTMCDADGELFIKPCTQSEVDFYESAHALHPEFAEIMPLYIGTLSLNENTDEAQIHQQIPALVENADIPEAIKQDIQSHLHLEDREVRISKPVVKEPLADNVTWIPNKTRKISTDRAVVLENASFGYKRPNIMDAKLGIRLWADDAPLQKKERFDKISAETTHKNLGFRVAGMRVYKGSAERAELDEEGYRIYDKDWGRFTVNDDNVRDSLKRFIFNEAAGIDEELGKVIAGAFATDLRRVQESLEKEETRMYSSSVLFVFEGDGEALKAAIAEAKAEATRSANESVQGRRTARAACANLRVDSGIGMDEEELSKVVPEMVELDGADDEDESDDDDFSTLPKIYSLKLIDFAHAAWKPGQGPDQNSLHGVRSLARLFEEMSL